MEEDDRSSVGTDQILGERFNDDASATYTTTFSLPDDDGAAKGEGKAAVPAAAAPADGLKPALPAQPSCPTSVLALEAALLVKYAAPASAAAAAEAAAASCDVRFMVDAEWLRQWNGYVLGQQGCLPPGPLTNLGLYDGRTLRLRQGLVSEVDYKALTPTAYHILAILYGTANDDAASDAAMSPEICRFGPNIYNAEVPPSKLREVSVEAKQRAHSEVNRLMARQRRWIIGGGDAEDAVSVVSSCSSFQITGRDGNRGREAGVDGGDDDEEPEAPSCCARWLYPLCFALVPASFHQYARDQMMPAGGRRRPGQRGLRGNGGAAGEVDDVQSIISASFTLEMGEGEEEDDDLLLWRSRPRRFGGRGRGGGGSLGLVGLGHGDGCGGGFGAMSTML